MMADMESERLILLATGRDRPGIVDRLSGVIYGEGCNLEDSRMAILGGEFALIVLVTGGPESLDRLAGGLEKAASDLELTLQVKRARSSASDEPPTQAIPYRLSAVSMDHPGILHKISHLLSEHGVNVARLDTRLTHAPVTGTPIFSLDGEVHVPAQLAVSELRARLAALAEAENIDIELRPT